jgi:histidinol phosphatase-like PHP family hydrolase
MNERIRQLAEQALQLVADEHTNGDEFRLNTDSHHVKDLIQAKFAELIVRECVGQIENLSPGYDDYRNQIEDAFRRDCVEQVKQHFGVDHV